MDPRHPGYLLQNFDLPQFYWNSLKVDPRHPRIQAPTPPATPALFSRLFPILQFAPSFPYSLALTFLLLYCSFSQLLVFLSLPSCLFSYSPKFNFKFSLNHVMHSHFIFSSCILVTFDSLPSLIGTECVLL